jgi:hypothetical protein
LEARQRHWEGAALLELQMQSAGAVRDARVLQSSFNDSRGLEQFRAGNPISLTGTVAGVSGSTLIIKDCYLH